MLRRNGGDDIDRIIGCNCFDLADSLARKTNKKVDKLNSVKVLILVFFVGFATNLIWENLQAPLYQGYEGFITHFLSCLAASSIDGVVIVAFYLIIGLLRKNVLWLVEIRAKDIFILVILGTATAFAFEKWAVSGEWWDYNHNMPIIFGVGLTPMIQLPVLSVLTVYLVKVFSGNKNLKYNKTKA